MIHESSPWKTRLASDADLLERWANKPCGERRSFLIEQKLFLAAYALRKLDEANRLTSSLLTDVMPVVRFAPTRPGYAAMNNHRFDAYFDLKKPKRATLPRRRVLNMLIHSLVFVEVVDDTGRVEAFMVTSEREREEGLFQGNLGEMIALMRAAAADYPSFVRYRRVGSKGRWRVWAGHEDRSRDG